MAALTVDHRDAAEDLRTLIATGHPAPRRLADPDTPSPHLPPSAPSKVTVMERALSASPAVRR
ncbi:hypothetical protein HTZ77_30570 [Nonomuraea sp. SMC257]|uniref:Uncharacterized protein n=1 Tax=Nonomuraea montanisoli TaxID=2741721 RepID=A0A7Y6ICV2_9ACTN|nr:hypothetical protein [Nonomuraea montanisoli]NUW35736.1 hypothetical protein [Nonomuraea montanisoli]